VNINQNISDNPADKDSAGFYDPSTESFPTSLEGKVLFYIAIAFSVFQVITAAHAASCFTCRLHGRQQQCHQNTDDGDNDEQFHERETCPLGRTHFH